jgi:hypothetical protein
MLYSTIYALAANAYFLTGSFSKRTGVFEAVIFMPKSEDGTELGCEVSRRVKTAVLRYSGPSGLRFMVCSACSIINSHPSTTGIYN